MGRITKDYDERYSEFLDVAQGLFFSKGYERTSVADIIKGVGVAKGTFYHYFDSKTDILDAIAKRMTEQIIATLQPMLNNEALNAKEKFEQFFSQIGNWKLDRKQLMLDMVRTLYTEDNLRLRYKMRREAINQFAPVVAGIIQQGCDEGLFEAEYPFETAELIIKMAETREEATIAFILAETFDAAQVERIKRQITAYNRSVERILGMSVGSLQLLDDRAIDAWVSALDLKSADV